MEEEEGRGMEEEEGRGREEEEGRGREERRGDKGGEERGEGRRGGKGIRGEGRDGMETEDGKEEMMWRGENWDVRGRECVFKDEPVCTMGAVDVHLLSVHCQESQILHLLQRQLAWSVLLRAYAKGIR